MSKSPEDVLSDEPVVEEVPPAKGVERLKVYDTGLWCKNCEWYELAGNITPGAASCDGCGCETSVHRAAHVVRA